MGYDSELESGRQSQKSKPNVLNFLMQNDLKFTQIEWVAGVLFFLSESRCHARSPDFYPKQWQQIYAIYTNIYSICLWEPFLTWLQGSNSFFWQRRPTLLCTIWTQFVSLVIEVVIQGQESLTCFTDWNSSKVGIFEALPLTCCLTLGDLFNLPINLTFFIKQRRQPQRVVKSEWDRWAKPLARCLATGEYQRLARSFLIQQTSIEHQLHAKGGNTEMQATWLPAESWCWSPGAGHRHSSVVSVLR